MIKTIYKKLFTKICDNTSRQAKSLQAGFSKSFINFQYGESNDNVADIYFVKDSIDKPTIVMIHGGGYISGRKEDLNQFIYEMLKCGNNVINMEYSKCDNKNEIYFPQPVYDFFRLMEVISHEPKISSEINYDKIFLCGDSSGAHIVSLISCIQTNPNLKLDFNLKNGPIIRGNILICPVFGQFNIFKKDFDSIVYGKDPIKEISKTLDVITPLFPPSLIITTKNDFISLPNVRAFEEKAKELNIGYNVINLKDGYKLFHNAPIKYVDQYPHVVERVARFIKDNTDKTLLYNEEEEHSL